MSERTTQQLQWPETGAAAPAEARAAEAKSVGAAKLELVELNYPDPTFLSLIVRDVARWSGQSFVMEPAANVKIQIFAPRRQSPAEAYDLFLASLSVVGLRAVQVGKVVKIVPVTLVVAA